MSQVDKGDATKIETQHKSISCQFLLRSEGFGGIQTLDAADGFCRDGSLVGLGDACIDILERFLLIGITFLHGFVVGGTKNAKIEGTGVVAYLRHVLQVCLVGLHLFCIYLFERNVLVVTESHIAVESCLVVLHSAELPILQQQGDEDVHELK